MDDKEFLRRMRAGDGPAWRWDRAGLLLANKAKPDAFDDPLTVAAWRLRCSATAAHGLVVTTAGPLLEPALTAAYQIFAGNDPVRWEIEARILAGETPEAISQKSNVAVGVIRAFCDLFFDVTDRLKASGWLTEHVGMQPGTGQTPTESQVWKCSALSGGPVLVDLLIADFHGRTEPQIANRHRLAEQARFMALEAVTGYSPTATKNLIRGGRKFFAGAGKTTLKLLADLHARGENGKIREQRKQRVREDQKVHLALKRFMSRPKSPRGKAKGLSSLSAAKPLPTDQAAGSASAGVIVMPAVA